MTNQHRTRLQLFVLRVLVGYFAPLIAVCRLRKKPGWDYLRQLRVVYRYTFWR